MKKTVFIPNQWVKFLLKGETCIGTTFLHDESDKEEPLYQLVFLITQKRKTKIINYCECIDIKYLQFVQKSTQTKELKIIKEDLTLASQIDLLIHPNIKKSTITTLAENQITKISRN